MSQKSKTGFGIFSKLLIVMVSVALIPLVIIWYSSNVTNTMRISRNVDQRLLDTATALGTFVDSWMEMNVRMLKQNSTLPMIRDMNAQEQEVILKSIVQQYDWNYLAFTTDTDGRNIGRSDGKGLKDYSDRQYVKSVISGKDIASQVLIGKTSGKPALVLAAPVKQQPDRIDGVLAIAMTLTDISERIASAKIEDTGFAFLIDAFGKVIAHPNQEFTNTRKDLNTHPAFIKGNVGETSRIEFVDQGRRVISVVRPISQGWSLVVQQDHDEAFAEIEKSNQQALIVLGTTFVVSFIVAVMVSRRLAHPIRRLTVAADEISHGNYHTNLEDSARRDELGELARAVERLGVSVRLATERMTSRNA
jgi:methyl-accepting chemotaxis protein